MTDEFVTRSMFTAMVAERDALAEHLDCAGAFIRVVGEELINAGMPAGDREVILANVRAMIRQLAAAHGLQARAERAEAQIMAYQERLAAIASHRGKTLLGHGSYSAGASMAFEEMADLADAAVPS